MRSMFSSPVIRPSTAENWPVTPIAARTACGSVARSWPPTRMSPEAASAEMRVERILTAVVLPAPFGPSREKIVAFGDGEVDAVEHDLVAVGLAQSVRRDGQVGHG